MIEEEQIEEKNNLQKIKSLIKKVGGKNLTLIILSSTILLLIIIIFFISIAGQKNPKTPYPILTPTPTLLPIKSIEVPIPESPLSSLEKEIINLKEELAKISLADPNLTFPNLDFSITLKPQ